MSLKWLGSKAAIALKAHGTPDPTKKLGGRWVDIKTKVLNPSENIYWHLRVDDCGPEHTVLRVEKPLGRHCIGMVLETGQREDEIQRHVDMNALSRTPNAKNLLGIGTGSLLVVTLGEELNILRNRMRLT